MSTEHGFPKWVYFAGGRSVLVKSAEHLAAQPDGWADTPAAFLETPATPAADEGKSKSKSKNRE